MGKREKGREALTDSRRVPPSFPLSPPFHSNARIGFVLKYKPSEDELESVTRVAISLLILFFFFCKFI